MAYTGLVDVSKNGSPTTLHNDKHLSRTNSKPNANPYDQNLT